MFSSESKPPEWRDDESFGQRVNTDRLNASSEEVRRIKRHLGLNLGLDVRNARLTFMGLGKVYSAGSAQYTTDCRYLIELSMPKIDLDTRDALDLEKNKLVADAQRVVVASNLSEIVSNTHSLAVDTPVLLFRIVREKLPSPSIHYVFVSGGIAGFFPVKVEKTAGSNGTKTTAASWTYTVRSIAWNGSSGGSVLGTGVVLTRPRPNGTATVQAGSTGYGSVFYDGSTLKLWDAGEIYGSGGC